MIKQQIALAAVLSTIILLSFIAEDEADEKSYDDETSRNLHSEKKRQRIKLFGLDDILKMDRSGIVGLGSDYYNELHADDMIENSLYDPIQANNYEGSNGDCWQTSDSTIEEEIIQESECGINSKSAGLETLPWGYGGADPDYGAEEDQEEEQSCVNESESMIEEGKMNEEELQSNPPITSETSTNVATNDQQCRPTKSRFVDKHWGSDINILKMRDLLRGHRGKYWNATDNEQATKYQESFPDKVKRPPIFLLPGLASTRLVSWKHKPCPQNPLLSDIKMLDYVWLNMNLLIQMATIDARCWTECMTLGKNQADYDDGVSDGKGACKLRPDEGIDSISSLAPGSVSSSFLVGGTNTVYAWLVQWLAENLGYDVSSIVALPYDWRLSPDKLESRDGFLTQTRRKIEAAVELNGLPGIMVAHSMGNSVFRYFLKWLRVQMREEAYERYVQKTKLTQRATSVHGQGPFWRTLHIRRLMKTPESVGDILGKGNISAIENMTLLLGEANEEIDSENDGQSSRQFPQLYEMAKFEGDSDYTMWLGKHIWTYVGLAAPLLGAPGPLRSVLSGENMGLPFTDEEARGLELSFGSTTTVHTISTKTGFCDGDDISTGKDSKQRANKKKSNNLACLEDIVAEIEATNSDDPWKDFPALRLLLKDRVDFDSSFATVAIEREFCKENEKQPCSNQTVIALGPKDVMSGALFDQFKSIWREKGDPLGVKLDQLRESWWHDNTHKSVPNMLETPPDRPHIKHVIMAYGVDLATEAGYIYKKTEQLLETDDDSRSTKRFKKKEFDGVPSLKGVVWEMPRGMLDYESKLESFAETLLGKKRVRRQPLKGDSGEALNWLHHSGDGTIPYLSLMWAHTWLLHAIRGAMKSSDTTVSILDSIRVSHRQKGGNEWLEGYGSDPLMFEHGAPIGSFDGDTGTSNPHGTKYKPKMIRFQTSGNSRLTGMEYTTTVIEAIGVEHKETTRNYDILAAAFTDVLKNLHADYGLI